MKPNQIVITKIINDDIEQAVFSALELLNAKQLFNKPKLKVLLKPNILGAKEPERAVTTHPSVVRAVIHWLKQFNLEKMIVAESSGTYKLGATDKAFKISGIQEVCEEENVKWTTFEKTERKKYTIENPLILKEVITSVLLDEVDIIINIPKIKTHGQCTLTCSIKNMFGTLILGNKSQTHARFPSIDKFSSALADIYSVSKPQLTVIDGYLCQEGNGPTAGDIVKMDIIMAGYDPVALDTTVCKIVDFNPEEIVHIMKAEAKGLGTTNLNNIEILGESIDSVKRPFKKPKSHPVSIPLPRFIAEYAAKKIFHPSIRFNIKNCKLCGTCWKNCPVKAIDPPEDIKQGEFIPKWNKKKCIACYCCHELCPYEAVDFKINIIKNVFTSGIGFVVIGIIISLIYLIWFLIQMLFS